MELEELKNKAQTEIESASDLKSLDDIFQKYLGKQGQLSQILRGLKELPQAERVKIGKRANEVKNLMRVKIDQRAIQLKEIAQKEAEEKEWIDITVPGKPLLTGHLHPLTQVKTKIEEIFQHMGFSVVEGPEIETEWYNFNALDILPQHPARDLWSTFWLKEGRLKHLLRTHTSPVQIRYMEKNNPPLRIIVPGRVFRHEATDVAHEVNFYHVEGLMIDKKISVANFKAIIQEFFRRFFEKPIGIRMRPSYFPFVEPGFEVDITCLTCEGRGCSTCSGIGWMEIMGAGMVHPQVFKNSGLNPKLWQGFAFGLGMDRLAMAKFKINDIRLFYSGDLRFLTQF